MGLKTPYTLTPLLEFTDSLSGETYVTVSYVKPVLHLFCTNLLKEKERDTQLTKELKTTIMTYLDEKYANSATDDLLDMAAFVDPRFKAQYITPDQVEVIKGRAVSEILDEANHRQRFQREQLTRAQKEELPLNHLCHWV